jgi:hypothetical protein
MRLFEPERMDASLPRHTTSVYAAFRKVEERELKIPQQGLYRSMWTKRENATVNPRNRRYFALKSWIANNTPVYGVLRSLLMRNRGTKVNLS